MPVEPANATGPTKKSIWKQIIEGKISNQIAVLKNTGKQYSILLNFCKNVRSDDCTNREAAAAKYYWRELFGRDFIRDRNGNQPNSLLNYGYSILRSAMTRAIIGTGLLPALGIHHRNRYNSFPLADDLMEPFRPWVDNIVYNITTSNNNEFNNETKQQLINVLYADTMVQSRKHPLNIALSLLCNSIIEVMQKETTEIKIPHFIDIK